MNTKNDGGYVPTRARSLELLLAACRSNRIYAQVHTQRSGAYASVYRYGFNAKAVDAYADTELVALSTALQKLKDASALIEAKGEQ